MTLLAHCFRLSLLALCFVGLCTFPARAQEEGRSVKLVGVDEEHINLEVDGRRVRIPLPDGYVVFTEEDYPEMYRFLYKFEEEELMIPLCGLVNAEALDKEIDRLDIKTAYFMIDRDYAEHRFNEESFHNEIQHLKELDRQISEEKSDSAERIFDYSYIYEDKGTLSELRIERNARKNIGRRLAYTSTDKLFEDIAIEFTFYSWVKDDNDINILSVETENYIKKLGKQ